MKRRAFLGTALVGLPLTGAYAAQPRWTCNRTSRRPRAYWNGRSEEAYGMGVEGVRKNVFLTSKAYGRTAEAARKDLETSLRMLKTDYIQPVALTQSDHLPALRAEPAGHANRHLRVRRLISLVSVVHRVISIPRISRIRAALPILP